jgi:hypothetical protein
MILFFQEN